MKARLKRKKFRLRPESNVYRRLAALFARYPNAGREPSHDDLKKSISVTYVIASVLDQEPEVVHGEYRFLCPFHADHRPSLWSRDEHSSGAPRWGCNPCGLSGDVFDFLQRQRGMTWREAVRWLSQRAEDFSL